MESFEIYKLKAAGLTNEQVLRILAICQEGEPLPPLEEMAKIARCRSIIRFVEQYRQLDEEQLRTDFESFPSLSIFDSDYPESLMQIYNPPVLLFYQGNLNLLAEPKIAVVGARETSREGVKSVEKIIQELQNQLVVVSGLAKGIDATAHYACIRNGGKTIGVIGTGLDIFYPKSNQRLQTHMSEHHLVLSEYGPGQAPLKFHFPERNRIIAGLCQAVIVAEARLRSGSLITCERAMEEGRDVFAIPGNILDGKSAGCHHLIQEGAKLVTSGQDILDELKYQL